MCEPVTMGIASLTVAAAGAAISAKAQYDKGKYQEAVNRNNAMVAGWQRSEALQEGVQKGAAIGRQARRVAGQALVQEAASGVETTVGSPANIFDTTAFNAAADIERAKVSAARAAWGFENEQRDQMAGAKMARRASVLGSVGSGITGATSLFAQGHKAFG